MTGNPMQLESTGGRKVRTGCTREREKWKAHRGQSKSPTEEN